MDENASDSTVSETAYASILPRRMGYVAKVFQKSRSPEVQNASSELRIPWSESGLGSH
jgi:hypothetical protein